MDHISMLRVSKTNNNDEAIAFTQSIGSRMSAMEHLVPEQMFSTETNKAQGISTVKALAIASQQGQKIWTINKDNITLALNSINLGADTESDIRNAVNEGKVVTAHEAKINFNGWVGEGYIVMEPETGAGAYIIAGGGNGSDTNGGATQQILMASMAPDFGKLSLISDIFDVIKALVECVVWGGDKDTLIDLSIRLFIAVVIVSLLTMLLAEVIAAGALIAGIAMEASVSSLIGFLAGIAIGSALNEGGWKFPRCNKI